MPSFPDYFATPTPPTMLEYQLSPGNVCVAFLVLWLVTTFAQKALRVQAALSELRDTPGRVFTWFHPTRLAAFLFMEYHPSKDRLGYLLAGFTPYRKFGSTYATSVNFSDAETIHHFCDGETIKSISANRINFVKDLKMYETMNIYGKSLVGTEGSEWKRHRAVARTAFNESNHALVWTTTARLANEWFEEIEKAKKINDQDSTVDILASYVQLTLLVITYAGFGRRISWSEDAKAEPPPGYKLAFRPAVTFATDRVIEKVTVPKWLYRISERYYLPLVSPALRKTTESFDSVGQHMTDVISSARAWVTSGKKEKADSALLRNLVEANMAQEGASGEKQLTDDELLSNTFLFLLAGHETSSHTLAFATLYLALYPEVQRKLYEETLRLWPDTSSTTESSNSYKECMTRLEYTIAVIHETLRFFPPIAKLSKLTVVDINLRAHRFITCEGSKKIHDVQEIIVPVKAGSRIMIDIYALHMNPIYWGDDVDNFDPERFIDTDTYRWPREAFNAFSSGPRSCIGERFALTEIACALANLVRRYKILVPKHLEDKPFEEQKKAMLQFVRKLTLTPINPQVRLKRRQP